MQYQNVQEFRAIVRMGELQPSRCEDAKGGGSAAPRAMLLMRLCRQIKLEPDCFIQIAHNCALAARYFLASPDGAADPPERSAMISIELAAGRVRPLADKGLLDPPSRFS